MYGTFSTLGAATFGDHCMSKEIPRWYHVNPQGYWEFWESQFFLFGSYILFPW